MTKRPGRSASNDPGLAGLLAADADAIVYVAKTWDYHVHVALGCTLEENLESIADSVKAAVAAGREAMVDCEHFFDGYKANPKYALLCAKTAIEAGARWAVLMRHQRRHAAAMRSSASSAKSRASFRAKISASTPTTTPATRSPTRSPPSAPARGRCRAR